MISDRMVANETVAKASAATSAEGALWQMALLLVDVETLVDNCVQKEPDTDCDISEARILQRHIEGSSPAGVAKIPAMPDGAAPPSSREEDQPNACHE